MAQMSSQGPYKNLLGLFRQRIGVTQAELSERLRAKGFRATPSYISQIEAGLKHIPYGLALAITEELGFAPEKVTEIFLPEYFTASEPTGSEGR